MTDRTISFVATDGWPLRGLLTSPDSGAHGPGVVLVPGSLHERDAWTSTAAALAAAGIASLRIDIRGRGASSAGAFHAHMPPAQRRLVRLDVRAAITALRAQSSVADGSIGICGEQDTAPACVEAAVDDGNVAGVALLSARGGSRTSNGMSPAGFPFLGLVSVEDHQSLRTTVDAYLGAPAGTSELHVLRGLGFGITMAAVQAFEHPDADPIESIVASWFARMLGA